MFLAIIFLLGGMVAGRLFRARLRGLPIKPIVFSGLLGLLFLMGAQIGSDSKILTDLPQLGFQALVLTCGAVGGSIFAAWCASRFFRKKHGENFHKQSRGSDEI